MGGSMPSPLHSIEGQELAAVIFVRDYVQFDFDGPRLTAITPPTIIAQQSTSTWGDAQYRNLLCERIGVTVQNTSVTDGQAILIDFVDGSRILISLRPEDYRTVEAATFNDGDDLWVW